jgi:uncharacterized Ntn-hydrolase superfamily protein
MTFSIVARDPSTGALGVATATAGPMVGALVPHGRSGLGAVATQAMTNPYLAIDTLDLLVDQTAEAALSAALSRDQDAERRQVIVVDNSGRSHGFTGGGCTAHAGHLTATDVAVAGNMLEGPAVLGDMLSAYQDGQQQHFARRLMRALVAGAAAGGDRRGLGSAALKVFGAEAYADIDLRVDASDDPLAALEHLLGLATTGAYAAFFATLPQRHGSRFGG